VIGLITEWRTATGEVERRDEDSDLGGTMRLGLQEQPAEARHPGAPGCTAGRHRRAPSPPLRVQQPLPHPARGRGPGDLGQVDGRPAGRDDRAAASHPWFLACQAHPEFLSTPRDGHPLFIGFVRAARERKANAGRAAAC
jgi:CTP synthase